MGADGRDLHKFYQTVTADEIFGLRNSMEEAQLLGVSDPIFRMEWLAEFAGSVDDSLFSLAAIEKCIGLDFGAPALEPRAVHPPLIFGYDPGLDRRHERHLLAAGAQDGRVHRASPFPGADGDDRAVLAPSAHREYP